MSLIRLWVLAICLSACVAPPIVIDGANHKLEVSAGRGILNNCRYFIESLDDMREDSARLGVVFGSPLSAKGVKQLIFDAFGVLGIDNAARGNVIVRMQIVHLYASSGPASKIFNAVLAVQLGDGSVQTFRGSDVTMNWLGAQAEYTRGLLRAMTQSVFAAGQYLQEVCKASNGVMGLSTY